VHILKMVLTYVEDWTGRNPGRKVRSTLAARHILADRRDAVTVMTLAEAREILNACDRQAGRSPSSTATRTRLIRMLLMETGLRPSEARGLSWKNVKLAAGSVNIAQRADAWCQIGACKSKAAYREVEISKTLASELEAWAKVCPDSGGDLVFPTASGRPISSRSLLRQFHKLQVVSDVTNLVEYPNGEARRRPMYTLYDIRHFRASWWIFQGIDLKRVTTWLGHSSIQMTFDVYGHIIKDAEAQEVLRSALEDVLYVGATWLQHRK
jgi:integrase